MSKKKKREALGASSALPRPPLSLSLNPSLSLSLLDSLSSLPPLFFLPSPRTCPAWLHLRLDAQAAEPGLVHLFSERSRERKEKRRRRKLADSLFD
jgi:hypothetical protein